MSNIKKWLFRSIINKKQNALYWQSDDHSDQEYKSLNYGRTLQKDSWNIQCKTEHYCGTA